jgi:hypothetical protein
VSKVKIRIDMDEGWRWWPVTEAKRDAYETAMGLEPDLTKLIRKPMTLTVDQALVDRYEAAYQEYRTLQEQLEQLYRVQEGIEPWEDAPIPQHTKLIVR